MRPLIECLPPPAAALARVGNGLDTRWIRRRVEGWDSERAFWEARSPVVRYGRYLHSRGWFNGQMEYTVRSTARRHAIDALNAAHGVAAPDLRHLFTDVYDELPWVLQEQQRALKEVIHAHRDSYSYVSDRQLEGL